MNANIINKEIIEDKTPKELEQIINKLRLVDDKEKCLRLAYDFTLSRYRGYRIKTFTKIFELFSYDIEKITHKRGFLHCTNLNYLFRFILIKSGCFSEDEITQKWTLVNYISPHQYLRVRIDTNKLINIDLWGNAYGVALGDYAHGFNTTLRSKLHL